jgi:signal transduction histidine kinase
LNKSAPSSSLRILRGQSRVVLLAGFGGLLLLMVFAGVDGLQVLRRMQVRSGTIQRDFLERSLVLNQIRSDVYLSGTYARDYLLDPQPSTAEKNRTELNRLRQEMDAILAGYARLMRAEERAPLDGLHRSLDEYWRVLDPVFQWSPDQRHRGGFQFLRDEVFPRRLAMLGLADQIEGVNERQMEAGNLRLAALFSEFRARLSVTLVVTLVLGTLLAMFASRRILDLEGQAASRYSEVLEARGQLKNLSARLVETQEEERRVLSRELHDEVGQSLSAILVGLSNLSAAIRANACTQMENEVTTLRRIVEGTVRMVRNITLLLRPSMLDDLGLIPALEWQAREVSRQTGLRVDVAAGGVSDQLPEEFKTCIYRVVQEALHNAARHAGAGSGRIVAQQEPRRLLLSILDDGCGFDVKRSRGLGLLGMEERVAHLGGTLQFLSEPGRGTLISVILPLAASEAGARVVAL